MFRLNTLTLAVVLALPAISLAQTPSELKREIDELKAQIKELKSIHEKSSKQVQATDDTVSSEEFNKVRVKVEALEDNQEAMGFKNLKFSGYIDPSYVYNKSANRGSMIFLNNNYNSDPTGSINDLTQDNFSYDNSYFGGVTVKIEKELEGGVKGMLSLRPRRTVANTYDFGSIIEEAGVWVPINGLAWKAWAGQVISWNGYEYVQSNLKKNITSNLLIDYAGPGFVTGAGIEYQEGKWWIKTALGNLNTSHDKPGSRNSGGHWRIDYSRGEFQGWGAAGMHGKLYDKNYNYAELDGYFIRGDWTLQGQVEVSKWKNSGFASDQNGKALDTGHVGVSALAAYKFNPRLEGIIRADYFDNHKGGGGTPATNLGTAGCPQESIDNGDGTFSSQDMANPYCGDYRGGFGPGAVKQLNADGSSSWVLGKSSLGAKRTALTLGLNYQYHTNALLKFELRHDMSDLYSFYQYKNGEYKKSNTTFGVQTVLSF